MLGFVYLHVIIKIHIAMFNAHIFMNVIQNHLKKKIDMNILIIAYANKAKSAYCL